MAVFTVYDVTIGTFIKGLKTFEHIIDKAEEYAKEKGLDANAVFPQARLIDDQNPFTFQVQNATKAVKVNIGRLTGVEPEPYKDGEKTLQDLRNRIHDALQLLQSVNAEDVNAKGDEVIEINFGKFARKDAVLAQGLPNFFFHVATGYSILRHKGVPVGKSDWITAFVKQ